MFNICCCVYVRCRYECSRRGNWARSLLDNEQPCYGRFWPLQQRCSLWCSEPLLHQYDMFTQQHRCDFLTGDDSTTNWTRIESTEYYMTLWQSSLACGTEREHHQSISETFAHLSSEWREEVESFLGVPGSPSSYSKEKTLPMIRLSKS